jgi:hypothetical protein
VATARPYNRKMCQGAVALCLQYDLLLRCAHRLHRIVVGGAAYHTGGAAYHDPVHLLFVVYSQAGPGVW